VIFFEHRPAPPSESGEGVLPALSESGEIMNESNLSVLKPLHLRRARRISGFEWGLSVAFGAIGIFTIGLALLVFAISNSVVARDAVVSYLPRDV